VCSPSPMITDWVARVAGSPPSSTWLSNKGRSPSRS
jgi:hypothetical protein